MQYDRAKLALKLQDIYRVRAKENQGTRTDIPANSPESYQTVDTREEIAKIAGVGTNTMGRVKTIEAQATDEEKAALSAGTTTINKVYTGIKAV